MSEIPWGDLTESAEKAIADIVVILAAGFTGQLVLRCGDGGVKEVLVEGGREAVLMLKESARQRQALTEAVKPK